MNGGAETHDTTLWKGKVLGIGDVLVDLSTHIERLPQAGGNAWGTAAQLFPGGGTANVATTLAALGISSSFAGGVGDDPYGRYSLENLQQAGVDTAFVSTKTGVFTGLVFTLVDETGERTFFPCARGAAHLQLSQQEVQAIPYREMLAVHACGISLVENPARDAILHALKLARAAGVPVYYDPNLRLEGDRFAEDYREAQWQAIASATTVLVSEGELALLCNTDALDDAVAQILERGPKVVVVKQGNQGAVAVWESGQSHAPTYPVEALDTSGAGDAFDAGFIAANLRGMPIQGTLAYANAAAAMKVATSGPRVAPTHSEVLAFLAARGTSV